MPRCATEGIEEERGGRGATGHRLALACWRDERRSAAASGRHAGAGGERSFCVFRPLTPHEGLSYRYGLWLYGWRAIQGVGVRAQKLRQPRVDQTFGTWQKYSRPKSLRLKTKLGVESQRPPRACAG